MIEVCGAVLDDLDGNNLLRLEVLALDHLAECSLAKNVEDKIAIPAREGGDASVCPQSLAPMRTHSSTCGMTCQDRHSLVPGLLGAQDVIDIQNVITVLVVVTIVLDAFARLCEYSPGIP